MSKKPSAQIRAQAKAHRSDAAWWKAKGGQGDRDHAAKLIRQARKLERGK